MHIKTLYFRHLPRVIRVCREIKKTHFHCIIILKCNTIRPELAFVTQLSRGPGDLYIILVLYLVSTSFEIRLMFYNLSVSVSPDTLTFAKKPKVFTSNKLASSKLRLFETITHLLTGVKCRATSVAQKS